MKPTHELKDPKDVFTHHGKQALLDAPVEDWHPPAVTKEITVTVQRPLWKYPPNDHGNAEAFVDRARDMIRYVPERGQWLIWKDSRWCIDSTKTALHQCLDLHERQWLREVAEITAPDDGECDDLRKAASKRALAIGNHTSRENVLAMARHQPRVVLESSRLDGDPWLVGVPNGVLDLKTCRLLRDPREHYVTKSLAVPFDPTAACPRWERFILEIMGGDDELAEYLQRCAGYSLTGDMEEQVFWFLYGAGSNGKSTFLDVMHRLCGDYSASASSELFVRKVNGPSTNVELAALPGVRFLTGSETQEGDKLNERLLKDITGGDTINARALYSPPFDFRPQCKIWMFGNHRPVINGTDNGIWRRVRLIPFSCRFPKDEKLKSELNSEMSGILNWMLRGCEKWRENGLGSPAAINAASSSYRADSDLLQEFVDECLEESEGAVTAKGCVYKAYTQWCKDNGLSHPLTSQRLSYRLKDRGMQTDNRDRNWLHYTVQL